MSEDSGLLFCLHLSALGDCDVHLWFVVWPDRSVFNLSQHQHACKEKWWMSAAVLLNTRRHFLLLFYYNEKVAE